MCVGSSVAAISAALSAARKHGPVYFRGNKLSHRKLAINWQLGNFGHKQSQVLLIWKWWIEWCLTCIFFYIWPDLKPEYHFKGIHWSTVQLEYMIDRKNAASKLWKCLVFAMPVKLGWLFVNYMYWWADTNSRNISPKVFYSWSNLL